MDERTRLGLGIALAAAVLGVTGDGLLRLLPWGLNVPLFALALVGLTAALASWHGVGLRSEGRFLGAPFLLFAAFFAWRDSDTLAAGFLAVALLNALNPDALIVRINLDRAEAGTRLDAPYLATLSADAVLPQTAALPTLPEGDRGPVAAALEARWTGSDPDDWRTYNLSRDRAREAVAGLRTEPPARARGSREGG